MSYSGRLNEFVPYILDAFERLGDINEVYRESVRLHGEKSVQSSYNRQYYTPTVAMIRYILRRHNKIPPKNPRPRLVEVWAPITPLGARYLSEICGWIAQEVVRRKRDWIIL